jgi:hypothetical protein
VRIGDDGALRPHWRVTFRRSPSPFDLPIAANEERQAARLIQEAPAWLDHYQPQLPPAARPGAVRLIRYGAPSGA